MVCENETKTKTKNLIHFCKNNSYIETFNFYSKGNIPFTSYYFDKIIFDFYNINQHFLKAVWFIHHNNLENYPLDEIITLWRLQGENRGIK